MQLAQRLQQVQPFGVMDVVEAAWHQEQQWLAEGRSMIHLSIGEPDFPAPPSVAEAGAQVLRDGRTGYALAAGVPALRQAIAGYYASRHGLDIAADRVLVTAGASGALTLACLLLVDPGSEVLVPDPCYPCNKNFISVAGGSVKLLPTSAATRFQPTAAQIDAAWGPATRGVLLASPSNPTGTSIAPAELAAIAAVVRKRGGFLLLDEIYLDLGHDPDCCRSGLALDDSIISINSFSKAFQMTGWRLGWMVVPPELVEPLQRLSANLFICPSSPAQQAALRCFEPPALAVVAERRQQFRQRRDLIVELLRQIGLEVPVTPDGAFYVWVDVSRWCEDSWDFCFDLMRQAGVVLVPGRDFTADRPERWVRLSYAASQEQLREAAQRIAAYLRSLPPRPASAA